MVVYEGVNVPKVGLTSENIQSNETQSLRAYWLSESGLSILQIHYSNMVCIIWGA